MVIHIVQYGETLQSIADKYFVSVDRIILDNGILNKNLVEGQSLVILQPEVTYVAKEDDTISSIANQFDIPTGQLLRNNRFFLEKQKIYPGEEIVISYNNNEGSIDVFGYAFPFIDSNELEKVLPYLTYLCVYGTDITKDAQLTEIEDKRLLEYSKKWGVIPILLVPLLIQRDIKNSDDTYFLLTNDNYSDKLIYNIVNRVKQNGYSGVGIIIEYINSFNMYIYENFIKKLFIKCKENKLKLFITISPDNINLRLDDKKNIQWNMEEYFDGAIIMYYNVNLDMNFSPKPITSVTRLDEILNTCVAIIDENKLNIGCPVIGMEWELPFIPKLSHISILKYYDILELARDMKAVIHLDEESQTPHFEYTTQGMSGFNEHVVWFIDASTIYALTDLVPLYGLNGTGHWNIMYYFAPLWSIINARFKINKLLPDLWT